MPAVMARLGLLAGVVSVVGFLAYLAAAQSLPLGPVTALRETSVIFGAVIGTLVLKEGFGLRRHRGRVHGRRRDRASRRLR